MNIALNYISDKQTKDKISVIPPADMIMEETDADKIKGWKRDLITYIDKLLYGDNIHTKDKETITDKVNRYTTDNPITVNWMGIPQVMQGVRASKIAHDENTGLLGDLWHGTVGFFSGGVNRAFTPEADNIGDMFLGYKVSGEYLKYGERLAACNKRLKELEKENELLEWQDKKAYEKAVKEGSAYGMSAEEFKEFNKDRGKWYVDKLIGYIKELEKNGSSKEVNDRIVTDFKKLFIDVKDADAIKMLVRRYAMQHKKEILERL